MPDMWRAGQVKEKIESVLAVALRTGSLETAVISCAELGVTWEAVCALAGIMPVNITATAKFVDGEVQVELQPRNRIPLLRDLNEYQRRQR